MELKLSRKLRIMQPIEEFNRTILELKQDQYIQQGGNNVQFNRTILELKLVREQTKCILHSEFNRTILELKPMSVEDFVAFFSII